MILATKSGWLIATNIIRETKKAYVVKHVDEDKETRISKDDKQRKLFNSTVEALEWIDEGRITNEY